MSTVRSRPAVVPAREANQRFSEILATAETGRRVVITKRGRPVAEIIPYGGDAVAAECGRAWERLLAMIETGLHLGGERIDRDSLYER